MLFDVEKLCRLIKQTSDPKKLQKLKRRCFTDMFDLTSQKIYESSTIPRWESKISVINSVSNRMYNMVFPENYDVTVRLTLDL